MVDNVVVSNTETITSNIVSNLEAIPSAVVTNVETSTELLLSKSLTDVENKLTSLKTQMLADIENIPDNLYKAFVEYLDDGYTYLNKFDDWLMTLPKKAVVETEVEVESLWSKIVSWFSGKKK